MIAGICRPETLTDMEKAKLHHFIYRYFILRNGTCVEGNIIGWITALAHARKYTQTIFENKVIKVEIVNAWTGEIISLEEAERRAARMRQRQ